MKQKDLFGLANKSISRHKGSRLMTVSLALAFVLITLAVWLILSFYGYMNGLVKGLPMSTFDVSIEKHQILPDHQFDDIEKMLEGNQYIEYFGFSFVRYDHYTSIEQYQIGDNEYNYADEGVTNFQFINTSLSDKQIMLNSTKQDFEDNNLQVLLAGDGFYGDEKKQIMISEKFATDNNIDVSDVVGEKLSFTMKYDGKGYNLHTLDKDNNPANEDENVYTDEEVKFDVKIFDSYEIVGVMSDEYCEYNNEFDFVLSDVNVDQSTLPLALNPVYTMPESDYVNCSKEITSNGKFYPFLFMNKYFTDWTHFGNPSEENIVIIRDYNCTDFKLFKSIYNYAWESYESAFNGHVNDVSPRLFVTEAVFVDTYSALEICAIAFIIFGVIIFIAVSMNILNLLIFHATERRKIFIINKAIGFTNKNMQTLYLYECLISFVKAFMISLVISVVGVVSIILIIEGLMVHYSVAFSVMFALAFLPIALVILLAISFLTVSTIFLLTRKIVLKTRLDDYEN